MLFKWPSSMDKVNGGPITEPRGTVREEVVELRDLLPTFLDVGGLSIPDSLNGSSLLHLLHSASEGDKTESPEPTWRKYLDLEHNLCYNTTNHWSALTDGHMKYIFQAYFDDEQLFDLDFDPEELFNLAFEEEWQDELAMWRQRMVAQLEEEQRGPGWVLGGKLMRRVQPQMYSPHYPGPIPL